MLYLNNPLLTSQQIIEYVESKKSSLSVKPLDGSKRPSNLSQFKSKLQGVFFHELVGCDLSLKSCPVGTIDIETLPKTSPVLIKQENRYYVYAPSTDKNWILTELRSDIIDQHDIHFPDETEDAQLLPYEFQYDNLYQQLVLKNDQKILGCDLVLKTIDLKTDNPYELPKKTPFLLQDGENYYIYGPSNYDPREWELTKLDPLVIQTLDLNFSDKDADPVHVDYDAKYQSLYDEIAKNNSQVRMDKAKAVKIKFDKKPSYEEICLLLETDERFLSSYPQLQQVLINVFSATEDSVEELSSWLSGISADDWNTSNAANEFNKLNTKYGYFDEENTELFKQLAIACRTMIVLFERNNDADDTLAYGYAYKLMVLFAKPPEFKPDTFDSISKKAHKLISGNTDDVAHPFHNSLLVKLDLPHAEKIHDREGWLKFIEKNGVSSFEYLNMADKIEKKISEQSFPRKLSAPKDMAEAIKTAALCRYQYLHYDPDFAALCHKYKVSEARFNQCLIYLYKSEEPRWPKKSTDSIPDIQIKGHDDAEGYYWVKLPARDKRALILGDITDCCQSIGGESEQCVKDAVSLGNNALYVLLKKRGKKQDVAVINSHGEINYDNFQIIGQSYVWKSKMGNLCLDSIECMKDSIPEAALQNITTELANSVMQENSDIHYVTVGRGGKTPHDLFQKTEISEQMLEGFSYGDAKQQYCISSSGSLTEENRTKLSHVLESHPDLFKHCMDYLIAYIPDSDIDNFIQQLEHLLTAHPSIASELTPFSLQRYLVLNDYSSSIDNLEPVDWSALEAMNATDRKNALESISTARLVWSAKTLKDIKDAISYLPESERLRAMTVILKTGGHDEYDRNTGWSHWLNESPNSSAHLISILNLLTTEERHQLLKEQDRDMGRTLLTAAIVYNKSHPDLLDILLSLGSEDNKDKVDLLNSKDRGGNSVLKFSVRYDGLDSINTLLDYYSEEELFSAVSEQTGDYKRSILIDAKQTFSLDILKRLSPDHRLEALMLKSDASNKTVFNQLTNHFMSRGSENEEVLSILDLLSDEQAIKLIEDMDVLRKNIRFPKTFCSLLNKLPERKQRELIEKRYAYYHPFDYDKVNELSETLLDLAVREGNADTANAILNVYPEEQRLDACLETSVYGQNMSVWQVSFQRPKNITAILKSMPNDEARLELWKTTDWGRVLSQASRTRGLTPDLLDLIPKDLLMKAMTHNNEEGFSPLHIAAYHDESWFKTMLLYLPEELQTEALNAKDKYGRNIWYWTTSKPKIVDAIPINLLIKENDSLRAYVECCVFFNKPNNLDAILQRIPNNERFNISAEILLDLSTEIEEYPEEIVVILNALTATERFEVLKQHIDSFEHPALLEKTKNILLETVERVVNDPLMAKTLKQQVNTASTLAEFKDELQDIEMSAANLQAHKEHRTNMVDTFDALKARGEKLPDEAPDIASHNPTSLNETTHNEKEDESSGFDEPHVYQEEISNTIETQSSMRKYVSGLRGDVLPNKPEKTNSVLTQVTPRNEFHPENTSSHNNEPAPVGNEIDWNFCLKCLSGLAAVAGGAMLVVGLLLPVPGLAIAGDCLLGVGVIGYSAASHQSSEGDEEELLHSTPQSGP